MGIPGAFPHVFIWTGIWQDVGYASIIYIASLAGVSPEYHEAAMIDGATLLKRIWHVDIPCLLPTMCVLLIMRCGQVLLVVPFAVPDPEVMVVSAEGFDHSAGLVQLRQVRKIGHYTPSSR
jgi:ABC-type polysaccharide transport system permease subunit